MNRGEIAKEYFLKGYNCSQAVVLSFKDKLNLDESTLLKISSPFGGGMGRLREVCGTVSGMFMVLGLLYGYDEADQDAKKKLYERVQELAKQFELDNGSIVCRELLGLSEKHSIATPDARTSQYYKKRPCPELIYYAANLLDDYINNHPVI